MGGLSEEELLDHTKVYSMSLPALVHSITSNKGSTKNVDDTKKPIIWKAIAGSPLAVSCPISVGGCLLAVGGELEGEIDAVTDIIFYQPDQDVWCKVGDLPSPLSQSACVMISEKEMLVAGGEDFCGGWELNVYIAQVEYY